MCLSGSHRTGRSRRPKGLGQGRNQAGAAGISAMSSQPPCGRIFLALYAKLVFRAP